MSGVARWFKKPSIRKQPKPIKLSDKIEVTLDLPTWYVEAKKYIGTKEIPGKKHNETIVNFFKIAAGKIYGDETPWCAAFINAILINSGFKGTGSLMARSFLKYGKVVTVPRIGDIVIISRGKRNSIYGHVFLFGGFDSNGNLIALGGNQSNSVNVSVYSINRLLGYRRPHEFV